MKRIIMHWTGGGYAPNVTDRSHYHFLIDGDGKVINGLHPVSANLVIGSKPSSQYAAHTRGANTGAIGIALCGMAAATERPFRWGTHPIKAAQIDAMVKLVAQQARRYGIKCRPDLILTHAEVQQTLGVAQSGKWDITVLPGNLIPGDAREIGDVLRARINSAMAC